MAHDQLERPSRPTKILAMSLLAASLAASAGAESWVTLKDAVQTAATAQEVSWKSWFLSEPGGPLDGTGFSAPGDWREFTTPVAPDLLWLGFSRVLLGSDGLERVAYRHEGRVYFAQKTSPAPGAGWRHELVAETGLEWGSVSLGLDYRGRAHLVFDAASETGRSSVYAVREPYGLWSRQSFPADAHGSALALSDSSVPTVFAVRAGSLWRRSPSPSGWEEAALPHGIAKREAPSAARGPDGQAVVAWVDASDRLLVAGPAGSWIPQVVSQGARDARFVASPEGGLAISFEQLETGRKRVALLGHSPRFWALVEPAPAAPPPAAPRPARWPWAAAVPLAALALQAVLVARRRRARSAMRAEAALVGGSVRFDVVVRDPRSPRWLPPSPGLVALTPRAPVLWVRGMRPGEAWLGAGWAVLPGRPGWIEARCGQVRLELAPESGLRPWRSKAEAERLLVALRAARERVRMPS